LYFFAPKVYQTATRKQAPEPTGSAGHVTFYVAVPDLEAALSKIEGLGGSIVMGPMYAPEGPTIAMFADPEGQLVSLLKAD